MQYRRQVGALAQRKKEKRREKTRFQRTYTVC